MTLASCAKESLMPILNSINEQTSYLSFSSEDELSEYVRDIDNCNLPSTRQTTSNFRSLWQVEYEEFMNSLDSKTLTILSDCDLTYEPEDELILDPSFAKILNAKREVKLADKVYRYVREGVLIYQEGLSDEYIESLDLSSFRNLPHGDIVSCGNGVSLMKISYAHLDQDSHYIDIPVTRSTINANGITLGNGVHIAEADVHRLVYDQSSSDANGFAQWISGVFGTNVVAINEFDSKHRITMRAFSQDYGIYRSVGMAIRMQQKVLGSWFRYKAEEIRYGWTGTECSYRFAGSFDVELMNKTRAVYKNINCYDGVVVFFNLGSNSVSSNPISSATSIALSSNSSYVNNWITQNPTFSQCPRGVAYFNYTRNGNVNVYDKLHLLYPRYEETVYNDRREHVTWDFNWFPTLNVSVVDGSSGIENIEMVMPELQEISILRGEFYGAVKYNGQWKACVIYNE